MIIFSLSEVTEHQHLQPVCLSHAAHWGWSISELRTGSNLLLGAELLLAWICCIKTLGVGERELFNVNY